MGCWDTYCCICCGPQTNMVQVGSSNPSRLAIRREEVEETRDDPQWVIDPAKYVSTSLREEEDRNRRFVTYDRDDDEMYGYDPEVLAVDDVAWLDDVRSLTFMKDAAGRRITYITPRGRPDSYGQFKLDKAERSDGNITQTELSCYGNCYPFHETCLWILSFALFGAPTPERIDKEALYCAFSHCRELGQCQTLKLDYGEILGRQQGWEEVAGEEYTVSDPGFSARLQEALPRFLVEFCPLRPPSIELEHKVNQDPFSALPYDIVASILSQLREDQVLNLIRASWPVFSYTRHNQLFWKQMLRRDVMLWFWELDLSLEGVEYKDVYFWARRMGQVPFGTRGLATGLLNRRRILNVCKQLGPIYRKYESKKLRQKLLASLER